MPEWEYRVALLDGTDDELEEALNEAGSGGWELVAVLPQDRGTISRTTLEQPEFPADTYRGIFKRPKQ